jgi:tetratricopeptide (TPR) repeat protein
MQSRPVTKFLLAASVLTGAFALGETASCSPREDPSTGANRGDNFIEIPGVGRIQMPPGVHVFQPRGADRFTGDEEDRSAEGEAQRSLTPPRSAAPTTNPKAPPKTPQQARAGALDALLGRLRTASDDPEAQAIANRVLAIFATTSSDTIALLSSRAAAAAIAGAQPVAEALLDDVIVLDPSWSEGFVRRARMRAARGDAGGAREDLEAALRIEPRRFDAFSTLGALQEEAGDKKAALDAYRRSLALDPMQEALQKSEERLRLDVEGRDI